MVAIHSASQKHPVKAVTGGRYSRGGRRAPRDKTTCDLQTPQSLERGTYSKSSMWDSNVHTEPLDEASAWVEKHRNELV